MRRLCEVLRGSERYREIDLSLVLSRTASQVYEHECGEPIEALGLPTYGGRDYAAPFASGSSAPDAMLVLPASMSCIARIAHGISDDLLTRAADVVLKERKRLVLVPREMPYSSIHLENMLSLTRAGAVVLPASPSFYAKPRTLEDAMDSVLSRALDHLGLPNTLSRRWGQDVSLAALPEPGNAPRAPSLAQAALSEEPLEQPEED
jgi:4-hydroxy-3-polyprenylbenzoate decarboxylase